MNIPKKRRTFCPHPDCKSHKMFKVTQYKKSQESKQAQGRRRYDRKQQGFGGQSKPILRKKVSSKFLLFRCWAFDKCTLFSRLKQPKSWCCVWSVPSANGAIKFPSSVPSILNWEVTKNAKDKWFSSNCLCLITRKYKVLCSEVHCSFSATKSKWCFRCFTFYAFWHFEKIGKWGCFVSAVMTRCFYGYELSKINCHIEEIFFFIAILYFDTCNWCFREFFKRKFFERELTF